MYIQMASLMNRMTNHIEAAEQGDLATDFFVMLDKI